MASIYRRAGTWWVSYYAGGKHLRRSLKTSSKRLAEREKQAIEAKLLDPYHQAPTVKNPRVDQFWEDYLQWAKDHKRPAAVARTCVFWGQLIEFTRASHVDDIGKKDIEGFKRWRREQGNSDQTVNNGLRELKAVFNRGRKLGLITNQNPVDEVEFYPIPKRMPDFHTKEELERLLEVASRHGLCVKWTVLLCGWAGLRKGEVTNCRWEWFDFDANRPVIHVKSFPGFSIKDHDERMIPMNRRIWEELYPFRQDQGYVIAPERGSKGGRYRVDVRSALVSALVDAELAIDKPYQRLRHSFGSILAQEGVSIFKVSKWMGHSSVQVTERHYAGLQSYDPDIDSF
jgi:integrase/recombinase XerD